jgi:hypothetical protein
MQQAQNFSGMGSTGSFYWWEGVVENNIDPRGAGRCQVRIIGHNTPLKLEERHDEFPWAYPIMPLNNPHGKIVALKPGTRVFGFFRDGASAQDCVMLGTINIGFENPGAADNFDDSVEPDYQVNLGTNPERVGDYGFVDDRKDAGGIVAGQPRKTKVTMGSMGSEHEDITDYGPLEVNEINTPRLARGDISGTITKAHSDEGARTTIFKAFDVGFIKEPPSPYAALYPFNTVEESDSGHVREIDDTPGAERIKETHRTGTFYEIHPDGTKVTKVVGDQYSITYGKAGVKISGKGVIHVGGEADFRCEQDVRIHGLKEIELSGENEVRINSMKNDIKVVSGGSTFVVATGDVGVAADGNINLDASGMITMKDGSGGSPNVKRLLKDTLPSHKAGVDFGGSGTPVTPNLVLQEGGEASPRPSPASPDPGSPDTSRPPKASDEIDVQFNSPAEYRAFIASVEALEARVRAQDVELDELRTLIETRGGAEGTSGI